eukprot:1975722-Pyramimonas_sp.AAC.1
MMPPTIGPCGTGYPPYAGAAACTPLPWPLMPVVSKHCWGTTGTMRCCGMTGICACCGCCCCHARQGGPCCPGGGGAGAVGLDPVAAGAALPAGTA